MIYKVYVIYSSENDRLFTGLTTSLTDCMKRHNSDDPEEMTTSFRPWTLVHMELFGNEGDALLRKTYLDGKGGQQYIREQVLPMFDF